MVLQSCWLYLIVNYTENANKTSVDIAPQWIVLYRSNERISSTAFNHIQILFIEQRQVQYQARERVRSTVALKWTYFHRINATEFNLFCIRPYHVCHHTYTYAMHWWRSLLRTIGFYSLFCELIFHWISFLTNLRCETIAFKRRLGLQAVFGVRCGWADKMFNVHSIGTSFIGFSFFSHSLFLSRSMDGNIFNLAMRPTRIQFLISNEQWNWVDFKL